jgi:penicillin-binding protein 1A
MRTRKAVPVHNLKVTRRGKVKKRSILWRWRRLLFLGVYAVVVLAAGGIWVLERVQLPEDPRKAPVLQQTSFICAADVVTNCSAENAMAQLHGDQDRELVTYQQIPVVLRNAVIATEDKGFFKHGGVDPMGIARAAWADMRHKGVRQGGSTITQQYVKQTTKDASQSVFRKIKEAMQAVKTEQKISKEEILTRYLNIVYFGRGAYGVQAASRAWFGHDVQTVNPGESAFLAGLLRNPNGADPYNGAKGVKEAIRRRHVSLVRMDIEGYISTGKRNYYDKVPVDPKGTPAGTFVVAPPKISTLGQKVKGAEWGSEYFVEDVRQWLLDKFGKEAVYGGGLKVYTTLDLDLQKAAYEAVTTTLDRPGDPSAALVAVDDQGQIKAMMGGTDFAHRKVNLATGKAGGGSGRQPGSTFKAFALAEAVREGYSIQSVLPSPPNITFPNHPECANGGADWKVRGGPGGGSSLVSATKNSINTVYAQLMVRLGPAKVLQMAKDLGVQADLKPYCALVLGGGEVSVLDMASAYSTFANNGIRKVPTPVTRVEFPDGRTQSFLPNGKEILTPDQAERVTYCLQQVIDGGTGADAQMAAPAAGKTGTTQNNADGWFVGFTPKLTAAVWMGYPDKLEPMTNVHGIKVQGGTFPARMWRKFMEVATSSYQAVDFPEPTPEALAAGNPLDPNLGKTSVVAQGHGGGGGTGTGTGNSTGTSTPKGTTQTTAVHTQTTVASSTTRPGSGTSTPTTSRPPATVPSTTRPVTTTTKPKPAAGGGTG